MRRTIAVLLISMGVAAIALGAWPNPNAGNAWYTVPGDTPRYFNLNDMPAGEISVTTEGVYPLVCVNSAGDTLTSPSIRGVELIGNGQFKFHFVDTTITFTGIHVSIDTLISASLVTASYWWDF